MNDKATMPDLKELYHKYDMELYRNRIGLVTIISIIFISLFGVLDNVMYPNAAQDLVVARISINLVLLILLFATRLEWINPKIISFVWSILIILLINILIIIAGEKSLSPYYAGLNLVVVSSAALLSWKWHEMTLVCITMLICYILSSIIDLNSSTPNSLNLPILLNNLFFLFSTSCFCVLATFWNSKIRFKEFCLNHELKNTISTLKTTKAQLVQSEKMNAIGSLSAGLLHEVNNPLNYTLTAVQLLKMDPHINSDEDLKDTVNDIDEGMGRIKTIVTDLRAFAYPEEADKKVQFLVSSAVDNALRFTSNEHSEVKRVSNIPEGLMISASQTHIVQVLINLISNAARAISKSEKNDGVITIEAKEQDGRIAVSVSDNGPGIDKKTLSKIFDPFFTTNEVGKGMGLGLSVSHTIIKNHNGELYATSKVGEGTAFYFDLETA